MTWDLRTSHLTPHTLQATYISSLISSSLYSEGHGEAGIMWVIEEKSKGEGGGGGGGGSVCGVNGAPPALPAEWQNVGVIVYVEETLQVIGHACHES